MLGFKAYTTTAWQTLSLKKKKVNNDKYNSSFAFKTNQFLLPKVPSHLDPAFVTEAPVCYPSLSLLAPLQGSCPSFPSIPSSDSLGLPTSTPISCPSRPPCLAIKFHLKECSLAKNKKNKRKKDPPYKESPGGLLCLFHLLASCASKQQPSVGDIS